MEVSSVSKRIAQSQGTVKPGFETWIFPTSARVRTGGFLLPGNAWRDVQGGYRQGAAGGNFPAVSTQNSFLDLSLRDASLA